MRKILCLCVTVLLLISCQKEAELTDPNNPTTGNGSGTGNSNGTRLVRIGSRVGSDTITTNISYTSAGRVDVYSQSATVTGNTTTVSVRAVRNSSGVITSTVLKADALAQFGLDSATKVHSYDAATSRYRHSVLRIMLLGNMEQDSAVYTYAQNGQLASVVTYYDDGSGYEPDSKAEYTYTGANIGTVKEYSPNGVGGWDLDRAITHEYDAKTNPLSFPSDAPVISMDIFYSANNPLKSTTVSGGVSIVRNIAYTYNASNRPVTAVSSGAGGTPASTSTYTYR